MSCKLLLLLVVLPYETTPPRPPSPSASLQCCRYGEGVLTVAGAYFAIGITAFIIFLTVYSFSCCCRAKTRRFGSRGCCAIFFSVLFSPRIWYFLASLALLGGTSAALAQVSAFKKSVRRVCARAHNGE